MQSGGDGDLELGADAIGGRDEDRVLEAGRFQIEERAEAAESRVAPRASRRFCQRLQGLDQCRAGIYVDSGLAVLVAVILAPYGVLTRCRV